MIDVRLYTTIFTSVISAGLTLIAVVLLLNAKGIAWYPNDNRPLGSAAESHDQLDLESNALEAANQRVAQLELENQAQSARIAYLEKQRFDIEHARQRREKEASFEQWYTANMPEDCLEPPYGDLDVECINDKIRAKRNYMADTN